MFLYRLLLILFITGPATAAVPVFPTQEEKETSLSELILEARKEIYEDFPKALQLLQKADSLAEFSKEANGRAEVAHAYGVAYYVKGDYSKSFTYYLEAIDSYREAEHTLGLAKGLVGLGLVQQGIDRHEEAVNLFKQAIAAYKESGNYVDANPAYLNIAISEIEVGEYSSAEENLRHALNLAKKAGRVDVEHLAYNKLAEIDFLEGDNESAISLYLQVLNHDEEPNGWEKSFAHAGLAQSYLQLERLEEAGEHGLKAMEFARNAHSLWDLERNSKILAAVYSSQGAMDEAYQFLQLNQKYKDSLYNEAKLREINFLQLESKEAENLRLQAEKEISQQELFFTQVAGLVLVLVIFLLVLLLVLLRRNFRQKEEFGKKLEEKNETILKQNEEILKQNSELGELNKAKNKLFSILSHDLKSPIGSIQQLLELFKTGEFSQKEQAELVDEMLKQISGTTFMLHNLLAWASSQMEGSRAKPEAVNLPERMKEVLEAYYWPLKQKRIEVLNNLPDNLPKIQIDRAQLGVILHNIVSNAIKYTSEGNGIEISYEENQDCLLLKIKDGGEGMAEEKIAEIMNFNARMLSQLGTNMETGTGIGLMLVKEFLQANKATLDIESIPGSGSVFILSFPKAE